MMELIKKVVYGLFCLVVLSILVGCLIKFCLWIFMCCLRRTTEIIRYNRESVPLEEPVVVLNNNNNNDNIIVTY